MRIIMKALAALILSPGPAAAPELTLVFESKQNGGTDLKCWGWAALNLTSGWLLKE